MNSAYPKLILPDDFDDRANAEMPLKGYLSGAKVQLKNGNYYEVFFIETGRLRQELELKAELGQPYVAEPGMVVLLDVTIENIEAVLEHLVSDGFFDNLRGLKVLP